MSEIENGRLRLHWHSVTFEELGFKGLTNYPNITTFKKVIVISLWSLIVCVRVCVRLLTGAMAVQQRAGIVTTLPYRISTGRHAHAAHTGGFRRGRRPLLRPCRERRRQGHLLGPARRRRRVADSTARRVTARNASEAGRTCWFRAAARRAAQAACLLYTSPSPRDS